MHQQGHGRRMGGRGMGMNSMKRGVGNGNRAPVLHDRPAASASLGSMRNEQLQIHELDLELALLKRKRELIEQQQHLLINEQSYGRPNDYGGYNDRGSRSFGGPDYSEPRSAPARNVGHYYEAEPAAPARYDRPYGKRPAPADNWHTNNPPKRFHAPRPRRNRQEKRLNPGPAPAPAPPRPAGPAQAARPTSKPPSNPPPKTRNFNPTKVSKPSQSEAPNKLNSYPVEERKRLVGSATHLTAPESSGEYTLRADEPASRRLVGRLELALGAYLKEMRAQHEAGPYAAAFRSPFKLRSLKQSVRERVRAAMLGKHAGSPAEIMVAVRALYPVDSDEEILQKATRLVIHPVEAVDPEIYLKQNFNVLLSRKLNDIFTKIQEMYAKDMDVGKTTQEIVDTLLIEMDQNVPNVAQGESVSNGVGSAPETAVTQAPPDVVDEIEPIENPLEQMDVDMKEADTTAKATADPVEVADNTTEVIATEAAEGNAIEVDSKPETTAGDNDANSHEHITSVLDRPAAFYNKLVDTLLKRRLPQVLPKFKDMLINILNSDSGYKETKAYLLQQTNKRAEELYGKGKQGDNDGTLQKQKEENQKAQPKTHRIFPFFVKIMGRPSLPKRKNMQAFLDQYHPASIKKHRGIHNLLFVALNTQEDYDNIMAANKTVIGNSTLDIRVGGKGKEGEGTNQKHNEPNDSEVKEESSEVKDDPSEVKGESNEGQGKAQPETDMYKLDESIDEQINDLFTSIGNDEAQAAGDGGDGVAVEAGEEPVQGEEGDGGDQQCQEGEGEQPSGGDGAEAAEGEPQDDDVQIVEQPNPEPAVIEIEDGQNDAEPKGAPATPGRALRPRQPSRAGKN